MYMQLYLLLVPTYISQACNVAMQMQTCRYIRLHVQVCSISVPPMSCAVVLLLSQSSCIASGTPSVEHGLLASLELLSATQAWRQGNQPLKPPADASHDHSGCEAASEAQQLGTSMRVTVSPAPTTESTKP